MKKVFFALFSICLFIISCRKDKTDPVDPISGKPYTNTVDGTRWTYEEKTQDPATGDTTSIIDTVTVAGGDTTVEVGTANQRIYRILQHSSGVHEYQNVSGNDYYRFQDVAAAGVQIQDLYLKDNVDVNGTWNENVNIDLMGIPVPILITYTVTDKGLTKIVNGITYNDVIGVKTDLSSSGLPPGTIVSDIKSYYARNVGLIEANYNVDVSLAGLAIHTQTLLQSADLH